MKTSTDIPKAPGIYRISIGPRTFYWGQAQNLWKRGRQHLGALKKGNHANPHLQASFDKHGEGAYKYEVSLLCTVEDLDMQEQFCLDTYHGTPGCANVAMVAAASQRGLRRSEETRAKISATKMGFKHSDAARAKISAAQKGVPQTPEAAASVRKGTRAKHPNILVVRTDGREEVWPSQRSFAYSLGHKNSGPLNGWLAGRYPIPAKYNIDSISRTNLPATINPEAL